MGSFNTQRGSGSSWEPEVEYLTVKQTSVILGVGDGYVRDLVVHLLTTGVLVPGTDVLEIRRLRGDGRSVRHYRQFRIHKETGLAKLRAYLTPDVSLH